MVWDTELITTECDIETFQEQWEYASQRLRLRSQAFIFWDGDKASKNALWGLVERNWRPRLGTIHKNIMLQVRPGSVQPFYRAAASYSRWRETKKRKKIKLEQEPPLSAAENASADNPVWWSLL